MSKKAFVATLATPEAPAPVRVSPEAPMDLPEREPKNLWLMVAIPALVVGLVGTIVMLYVTGVRSLSTGFFPMMGIAGMLAMVFSGRLGKAKKIAWGELEKFRRKYLRMLDTLRSEIQKAVRGQRQAQARAHVAPESLGTRIGGEQMWSRARSAPNFLDVRLGIGVEDAPKSVLSVTWPDIAYDEELEPVTGGALRDFILEQTRIRDIAKVVDLKSEPGFSFVGDNLDTVRALLRSVSLSLAVFQNPRDVKLIVVTRNPEMWEWMMWLPHNIHDELYDACGWRRLIFTTPTELEEALSTELGRRSKTLGTWTKPTQESPTTMASALESDAAQAQAQDGYPHWVIIDDNTGTPEAWEGVIGKFGMKGTTVLRVASRVGARVDGYDQPGFGQNQVFEVIERPAIGRAGGQAPMVPLLRHGGKFFARADQLALPRAYRYARSMARFSATSSGEHREVRNGAAQLLRSRGVSDARKMNLDKLWRDQVRRGDDGWCKIPVGTKPNGELQYIIFRAKEYGGHGFHSFVIGTSGSGKSEFFLALVTGIATTHSPDAFNVIFVDMKFDSAAQSIAGLPHVVGALSNVGEDTRGLAERMRITIEGEIKRRYELFKTVDARDANVYEEIRLAGRPDLEPVPVLLVIIDEYLELFAQYPAWIETIIRIGRIGRGANVIFMLGGQQLDLSSLQKIKSNIGFRVALRCESGEDSSAVIGSDAAFHLPSAENGHALLKVGPSDLQPFRCFYMSADFVLPKSEQTAQTVDMLLRKPRKYTWEHVPLDAEDTAALEAAAAAEAEPDEFLYHDEKQTRRKLIIDVVGESVIAGGSVAPHEPWLPPLEFPERIDALVEKFRGKPWYEDYGNNRGLTLPFAMVDLPEQAKQLVHSVDALRQNVIVVGAKQRGKTNTLMTLICSAAMLYPPSKVQFYCIGKANLQPLLALPHVAGTVSVKNAEAVERAVATMESLVALREHIFRREEIDISDYRERGFGGVATVDDAEVRDIYGEVFLVVDDFADLWASNQPLADRIIGLSGTGLDSGVHVMTSASGWVLGGRRTLVQNSLARIQLRLAEPNESEMGSGRGIEASKAAEATLDIPGFGLTDSLHEMQVGVPAIALSDDEVGGVREIGQQVVAVSGVTTKPVSLQVLPEEVALSEVVAAFEDRYPREKHPLLLTFGIGEQHGLGPVPLDLRESPGMATYGRAGCGKSTWLMAIGEAVMARFSPEQAQLSIIDPSGTHSLAALDNPDYVHVYASGQDKIDAVLTQLAREVLLGRLVEDDVDQKELRKRLKWEGPRHFVLIDNVQELRPQISVPKPMPAVGAALWSLLPKARSIGLHLFTTFNTQNLAALEMNPWVKAQRGAKVAEMFMDNNPQSKISSRIRAQELPKGRGLLLRGDSDVEGVLVGTPDTPVQKIEEG